MLNGKTNKFGIIGIITSLLLLTNSYGIEIENNYQNKNNLLLENESFNMTTPLNDSFTKSCPNSQLYNYSTKNCQECCPFVPSSQYGGTISNINKTFDLLNKTCSYSWNETYSATPTCPSGGFWNGSQCQVGFNYPATGTYVCTSYQQVCNSWGQSCSGCLRMHGRCYCFINPNGDVYDEVCENNPYYNGSLYTCSTVCTGYGNGACNGGYTSYSGPSGGYVSGTTCINTTYYSPTYICPNGGTLSGTSCIKSMSSSLQAATHCLTN